MAMTEEEIRQCIGKAVRDADFANDLANAADEVEFINLLGSRGWSPDDQQKEMIKDNLDALKSAAGGLDDLRAILVS